MASIKYISLLSVFIFFLGACSTVENGSENETIPTISLSDYDSILSDYFFDQGAWFGLKHLDQQLGFELPLILSDSLGYLWQPSFLSFSTEGISEVENHYYPGKIQQVGIAPNYTLTIETIYTDHQTALSSYTWKNTTEVPIEVQLNVNVDGRTSPTQFEYQLSNSIIQIEFQEESTPQPNTSISIEPIQCLPKETIEAGESITHFFTTKHIIEGESVLNPVNFKNADLNFEANNTRWKAYLNPYSSLSKEKKFLAAKCFQTLINNWRVASGELKHDGLFPSYHQGYFNGFWAWDSWKHAVALATFEPEVAKDQVRAMFDFQDEHGMIADAVFRDTLFEKHNWRNTKPPLAAWAVYEIFQATNDDSFVKEMLPQIIEYHEWWYTNRDHNQNGLCEFGSTDGTRIAAAWESGMDNAVRFDQAKMLKNNEHAWSLDQESVDLNSFLYAEKYFLKELLKEIGDSAQAASYGKELEPLRQSIIQRFYDHETGYFYDYNFKNEEMVKVYGPEAWTALWAGVLLNEDKVMADKVVSIITDPDHFNTHCPFPTLDASHPDFNPKNGYWRGPVWLDQAYFALKGMRLSGHNAFANEMRDKLFKNAEGLLAPGEAIRENYHPSTGDGLNVQHFSWSAAHIILLLKDETLTNNN